MLYLSNAPPHNHHLLPANCVHQRYYYVVPSDHNRLPQHITNRHTMIADDRADSFLLFPVFLIKIH